MRKSNKVLLKLPIVTSDFKKLERLSPNSTKKATDLTKKMSSGEYLYACKFFSSSNHHSNFEKSEQIQAQSKSPSKLKQEVNYSTVLACGSGTQSLHLIDYEKSPNNQHLASFNCKSPLYCLDAIYSCSMIACGGMRKFFTLMGAASKEAY